MNKPNNIAGIILVLYLVLPFSGYGQSDVAKDTANTYLINVAREIIAAAGVCTLITLDEEGKARARAMDAFLPDENFEIWFGTNPHSRKVSQIKNDPRVTLYYFDKVSSSYVMIYGEANIIDVKAEKEKYWKEEWLAFYPDYPTGYALISVLPEWMEVVSESRGITGDSLTWQPPGVTFNK